MKTFSCACGNTLFFENTRCQACGREAGWCPACAAITALEPSNSDRYQCANPACGTALVKCANYAYENVCNRCVVAGDGQEGYRLCDYCRFNQTIPDLSVPGNRERWGRLEAAKRRTFYGLDLLGLPYGTAADGFEPPLSFHFKDDIVPDASYWRSMGDFERVYTGHANGQITINIREADDVEREKLRVDLGEAHRTLIGHFRHEIGHYYWEVLIHKRHEDEFSRLFGDHRTPPYDAALQRYYQDGPPSNWRERFVSAYATMHPWEDWAETFALYLDLTSVLDTATQLGLTSPVPFDDLDAMIVRYRQLGLVLNELNREMGLIDLVPEIITTAIMDKLTLIHRLAQGTAAETGLSMSSAGTLQSPATVRR